MSSSDILGELGVEPTLFLVERNQLRWFGHVIGMPAGRLSLEVLQAQQIREEISGQTQN